MIEDFEEDPTNFDLTPMEYVLAALAQAQAEDLTMNDVVNAASSAQTAEEFDNNITFAVKMKNYMRGKVAAF
jgi:hypothetical protein